MQDVVVIGAGLSGLRAAEALEEAGLTVQVVEANDRVGGRTLSVNVAGHPLDAGAHWVGPGQDAIWKVIKRMGIETFPQHTKGVKLADNGVRLQTFTGDIPPASLFGLLDFQFNGINPLDGLAKQISLQDPLSSPNAKHYDGITLEAWKQQNMYTQDAKELLDLAVRSVLGVEAADISFLYFLFDVRSSRGVNYLTQVQNGAQSEFLKGGTQQISLKLAAGLRNPVLLSSPAVSITQTEAGVVVETLNAETQKKERIEAKCAILAIPPNQQKKIQFSPRLPVSQQYLAERSFVGTYIKAYLVYETPFWRTKGFSGEVMVSGEKAEISLIYDTCYLEDSFYALAVFIVGKPAEEFKKKSAETQKESLVALVARYFGEEAKNPRDYQVTDWSEDFYSAGPVAVYPPGVFYRYGAEMRKPFGRLFFAGTETALNDVGYMSGAIEAGERAAGEVISLLSGSS